jgi:hypothetical protein
MISAAVFSDSHRDRDGRAAPYFFFLRARSMSLGKIAAINSVALGPA